MNSVKAYTLSAFIVVMGLIIIGVSMSYAYYYNSVSEVNTDYQGVSVTSGDLTMNFTSSQYINANAAGLIKDSEILTKADYTSFSITLPSNSDVSKATYNLYLTETKLTNNFKSEYLKWALYSNDVLLNEGDFSSVDLTNPTNGIYTASNIDLLNNHAINKGDTISYKLYIWLSYDENERQNDLLEGSLSTKVAFKAVSQ